MGVAYVRGVQGQGVDCCGKHFIGHGSPLGGLNHGQVVAGPRQLRDVEAAPFRAAIHEAGLATVMNAVQRPRRAGRRRLAARSSPTCSAESSASRAASSPTTSRSTTSTDLHHIAARPRGGGAPGAAGRRRRRAPLLRVLRHAARPGAVRAARRSPSSTAPAAACSGRRSALGLFDDPYVGTAAAAAIETPDDLALARRAAARSMVLLTNDGTLPLRPGAAGRGARTLGRRHPAPLRRLLLRRSLHPHRHRPGRRPTSSSPTTSGGSPVGCRHRGRPCAERFEIVDDLDGADVAVVFVGGQQRDARGGHVRRVPRRQRPPAARRTARAHRGRPRPRGVPTVVVVDRGAGPLAHRGRAPRRRARHGVAARATRAATASPTSSPATSTPAAGSPSPSCARSARSALPPATTTAAAAASCTATTSTAPWHRCSRSATASRTRPGRTTT